MTDTSPFLGNTQVIAGSPEPGGFFGPYRGVVTNTSDPAGMSRIKAVVPQLFGNASTEIDWALPCQPAGYAAIPQPGQGVWISFEGGDINYPVYMGMWQPGSVPGAFDPYGAAASAEAAAIAASDPRGSATTAAAAAQAAAIATSEAYTTAQLAAYQPLLANPCGRWYTTGVTACANNSSQQIVNTTQDYLKGGVTYSAVGNSLTVNLTATWRISWIIGSINGPGNGLLTGTVGGWVENQHGAFFLEFRGYISGNYPAFGISDILNLTSGDTLTLYMVQGTGASAFADPANGLNLPCALSVALESI